MEVLLSSSSPLSVHSRLDFYALKKLKDPIFAFHSNNCNTISSSFSSCSGISISQRHQSKKTLLLKRFNSSNKRRILQVSAVFERFTERAIKTVIFSQREARALGKDMVFTQHLLLGLIGEDRDPKGFLGSGIKIDEAREVVKRTWHSESDSDDASQSVSKEESGVSHSNVPFSISTKRVFEAAVEYSRTMGHNFIAPEHLAIGLFTVDDGSAGRVLKRFGVDGDHLAAIAVTKLQGELVKDGREPSVESKGKREKSFSKKAAALKSSEKSREKSALAQFCVDLTAQASEGLIDPVIGRHSEIERIVQILCRRTKNNPILLGESGVGKTAIAEGLAISIAQADVPVFLLEKRVMSLDVGLLIAGAKERGELEARVTTLIREILKEGNIILFIDEVHTLVGSGTVGRGNKGSGLDIANLLKPSLGRGEFQCIASTTVDEYRTHFENDKALARRFQPVLINEPSQEDAVRILLGLRQKYEAHHNCRFTLEAINAAVNLSARYIADRYLPDKAIDLIDEAGSRARIEAYRRKKEQQTFILSKSPDDYWQEIRTVQAMHEVVLASRLTNDDSASSMDGTGEITLESRLPPALNDDEPIVVGLDDIAVVASLWSGIPVQQLTADERMFLVGLEEELRKRVIGQDEAVAAISRAVKRSAVGLKDPDRPIAAMLFCGPTGVGKTELTKALARSYFGSESAMLRLDMSEYMERHTVSKLIGAPPGYVGYGEGGILTEAIRKQPFTVVLLDEIEKAHPDIFNILLQLFEDGHLTDSQGRRVSFKNALVVMTSNVGSSAIEKGGCASIGFMIADNENSSYAAIKALVMEELKGYFRPELLNRIDEVVVFHPLEKAQMLQILNLMLQEVKERLISLGIGLEVSESIKALVCQQGYDKFYGARPLRRAVTQIMENPLSEAFLAGEYKAGDTAFIDLDASGNPVVSNWSDRNIIEGMMKKGMKVEAVDVACIFGIEDKFPTQKLLTLILQESREPLKGRKRESNNSPAIQLQKEAKEKQLIALKSVVKFLEEHQLDPTKLLLGCQLEEKIIELEKDIADLNKKINKLPLSKRPANVNEVSNYWKSQEIKRRRFAEKGSPLISPGVGLPDQIAASYVDGQSSYNSVMRLNGGFPGHVNNHPAGTSAMYGSSIGPFPENVLGATAASGIGLSAAYGGSAGIHRDMLVDGMGQIKGGNVPPYAWHRAGDTALNGGSVGHWHPASGLFGQSPSIEGFAGLPNSPPAVAANGSSGPDLYGFADAPSLPSKHGAASDLYGFADAPTVTTNQTAASDLYGFADAVAYGSNRHTGPLPPGLGSHHSSYMR